MTASVTSLSSQSACYMICVYQSQRQVIWSYGVPSCSVRPLTFSFYGEERYIQWGIDYSY